MKKAIVQTIIQGGNNYGQVSNPADLMKAQDFLHARISDLTRDFLNNSGDYQTSGFSYALGAFSLTVNAPGTVYAPDGKGYDLTVTPQTLSIDAADPALNRLDIVVAVLESDVDAAVALLPFVRLRTSGEFAGSVPPYPPTNFSAPAELHQRVALRVKKGTPAATPAMPALAANEIPLYLISVVAGALQILDSDVSDLRNVPATLQQLNDLAKRNQTDIDSLLAKIGDFNQIETAQVNMPRVFGAIRTLGDILASLQEQLAVASGEMPEIRYSNPKVPLTNPDSSKIIGTGNLDGSTPVVDVALGGVVNFSGKTVTLHPTNFADASLNARFAQVSGGSATELLQTNLTLNGLTQIASDGATDFTQKTAQFSTARSDVGCAARDGRYIEIFGGLAANNSNALAEWLTYDTQNDTLTPRTPSITLPTSNRPAMITCGDGANVLLIAGNDNYFTPRCFKVNAADGSVAEITTTKPTGAYFFGDLIAPNKIFIVAVAANSASTSFWEFDTSLNTFTQLTTTGNVPACAINKSGGCYKQQNQFLLFDGSRTITFNRADLSWTLHNIAPPSNITLLNFGGFRLANVSGRPILIGVDHDLHEIDNNAKIWELTESAPSPQGVRALAWRVWDGTSAKLQNPGFCSTLVNGFAAGRGFLSGGKAGHHLGGATTRIYASLQGGLAATVYKGAEAVTIAAGSTFVQFTIPNRTNPWSVAGYMAGFEGDYNNANLKIEVSFDSVTWLEVTANQLAAITASSNPGVRQIKITLYNLGTSKPVLSKLTEMFDQNGAQLEDRTVIRFNSPSSVKALYLQSDGSITLSSTIEPSTPTKAILQKITPNGTLAPTVKNYINRRRPHVKYSKVKGAGGDTMQFDNELAVPVRYVDARAFKAADNSYFDIPEPTVAFDATVTVTGVTTNGDSWIVELEG